MLSLTFPDKLTYLPLSLIKLFLSSIIFSELIQLCNHRRSVLEYFHYLQKVPLCPFAVHPHLHSQLTTNDSVSVSRNLSFLEIAYHRIGSLLCPVSLTFSIIYWGSPTLENVSVVHSTYCWITFHSMYIHDILFCQSPINKCLGYFHHD